MAVKPFSLRGLFLLSVLSRRLPPVLDICRLLALRPITLPVASSGLYLYWPSVTVWAISCRGWVIFFNSNSAEKPHAQKSPRGVDFYLAGRNSLTLVLDHCDGSAA